MSSSLYNASTIITCTKSQSLSFRHSSFSLPRSFRGGSGSLEDNLLLRPITFTVSHRRGRPLQAFTPEHFKEVVVVAKELMVSCPEVAKKLIEIHRPVLKPAQVNTHEEWDKGMELIKILIAQDMYSEAENYSKLMLRDVKRYNPPREELDLLNNLKYVIFCGLDSHDKAAELRKTTPAPGAPTGAASVPGATTGAAPTTDAPPAPGPGAATDAPPAPGPGAATDAPPAPGPGAATDAPPRTGQNQ